MALTVSLLASSALDLLEHGLHAAEGAERVEVRLDHTVGEDLGPWRRAILALNMPFVVALHGSEGLGSLAGTLEQHVGTLREAAAWGASFVDVDSRYARDLGPLPEGCQRIVSMHLTGAFDGEWVQEYEEYERGALPTDVLKFVVRAESALQGLQVMEWARGLPTRQAGRIIFCMGERVAFTRIMAHAFGDPWVYVAPNQGAAGVFQAAARGQYTLAQLSALHLPEPSQQVPRFMGVLGHPIEHSLSPEIQGAALKAAGQAVHYMAIDPGGVEDWNAWLQAAARFGFEGFAVTAPFKALALQSAAGVTAEAQGVGAANTLALREGLWQAHNSDGVGVRLALEKGWAEHGGRRGLGSSLAGRKVLIVGAGGAARAVWHACKGLGMHANVCVRRPAAGAEWVREFGGQAWRPWQLHGTEFDCIVNTTPMGWGGQGLAVPPGIMGPETLVMDAVYHPQETPLLWCARQSGAATLGGQEWFLGQAEEQFRWLLGERPERKVLRQALQAGLARQAEPGGSGATRPLALIGMRAVGKTTLGKALAESLGHTFTDADDALLHDYQQQNPGSACTTVGQVLESVGLLEFRRLEQICLQRLLGGGPRQVIATGGGVVETEACRALLADSAHCLWLDLSPEELRRRLEQDSTGRPSLTGLGTLEEVPEIYARRFEWYGSLARWALPGDIDTPGRVPEGLATALRNR